MKFINSLILFCGITLLVTSCKKDTETEPEKTIGPKPTITIEFQAHVKPLFDNYCNGGYCHGGGADGKYFDTHANVVMVPNATLLGAINHTAGFEPMPKSQPKLRQGEIDTITTWINEGSLNN